MNRNGMAGLLVAAALLSGCGTVRVEESAGVGYDPSRSRYDAEMASMEGRLAALPEVPVSMRPTVFFWEFANKTRKGRFVLDEAPADMMVSELQRSMRFRVLDRLRIQAFLDQQRLDRSDLFESSGRAAELLSCEYQLHGVITILDGGDRYAAQSAYGKGKTCWGRAEVELLLYDARTGELVRSGRGVGRYEETIVQRGGEGPGNSYGPRFTTLALRMAIRDGVLNLVEGMGEERPKKEEEP